jgi:hypothetical protein
VMSMYRDRELDVHPEFQRIFRWTDEQKARLVESILLGIPIPTIFVAQRPDGVWDVIDGVQRLSTILQFVGLYRDVDDKLMPSLRLLSTEYLPVLAGFQWEVDSGNGLVFSEALRRDFKRAKLEFRIIKKESDPDAKFDLFQRLNSGTQLSPQEARNCLMVMLNPDFFRWVTDLARESVFDNTVLLSDRKEDEGFRQELVLRFMLQLSFSGGSKELAMEFSDYLTDWTRREAEATPAERTSRADQFRRTFSLLNESLGEDCFRRYDADRDRFLGPFSISAFEAITSGVGTNLLGWEVAGGAGQLRDRVKSMWSNEDFRENSGTGVSPRRRAPRLIHFGRTYFSP